MAEPLAILGTDDWTGLRAGVVGLGRSGRAAVELLRRRGAAVRGFDDRPDGGGGVEGVDLRLADAIDPPRDLTDLDLVVLSPGVDPQHFLLVAARRQGVPVMGEIELASRVIPGPIVGITGTNGKSTTASWTDHLLRASGREAVLGGNIGVAATAVAEGAAAETIAVLELSSFQLESIDTFRPRVAVMLNLAPDHLDRYEGLEAYAAAKRNLLRNLTADDWYVYGAEDPTAASWAETTAARPLAFTATTPAADGVGVQDGVLTLVHDGHGQELLPVAELPLLGRHNVRNAAAVAAIGTALGLTVDEISRGLRGFAGLPHRTQPVATRNGVVYVDDSKATNVHAALASLSGWTGGPLVLLLGGSGKGEDYRALRDAMGPVRLAVCYGAEGPALADALTGACDVHLAPRLADAFTRAQAVAESGDTVLLSPACASFDEFRSFEHRGDVFTALAREASA